MISDNQSEMNLFLKRKRAGLGLGWQRVKQLWASNWLSLLLLVRSTKRISHQLWASYGAGQVWCWQTKRSPFFPTRASLLLKWKFNAPISNFPKEKKGFILCLVRHSPTSGRISVLGTYRGTPTVLSGGPFSQLQLQLQTKLCPAPLTLHC